MKLLKFIEHNAIFFVKKKAMHKMPAFPDLFLLIAVVLTLIWEDSIK